MSAMVWAQVAKFPPSVVDAAKRKLSELEDLGEISGGEAGKKLRSSLTTEERAEGMALVRNFLKDFSSLPLNELDGDKASSTLAELKDKLRSSSNPLIAAVCAKTA